MPPSQSKPPGVTPLPPAQQIRSQRTAERIVAAAIELLGQKGFDKLSVAEIAGNAGISVGGFYARFPGKQALLQYIQGTVIGGLLKGARRDLAEDRTDGLPAREIIRIYMAMATRGFRKHRTILQQISLRSRTSADPEFRRWVLELNIELHDLFRARLHERELEFQHPSPRVAIDIALTATSAVMREYILFDDLRPQFTPVSDKRLVNELTELFASYLRIQS